MKRFPSRLFVIVALFFACLLYSCAEGNVGEKKRLVEDGPVAGDPDTGRVTNTQPPPLPTIVSADAVSTEGMSDASSREQDARQLSALTVAVDAGEPTPDRVSPGDVGQFAVDRSPTPLLDVPASSDLGARTYDASSGSDVVTIDDIQELDRVTPPDGSIYIDTPPISVDVAHPDIQPMSTDAGSSTPMRELCNDRDDDGNGLADEIFECRIGRVGSTCVTSCGANGYQICGNDCRWSPICRTYPENCNDTIDNDCNGRVDCADPLCVTLAHCNPIPPHDAGASVDTGTTTMMSDAGMVPVDVVSTPLDIGRADGCHDLVIRLNVMTMPRCSPGWVSILYDSEGRPHESAPNGTLTFTICGRLRGQLVLSARCGGTYLLDWPGIEGRPVREGGVASIQLDGNELADAESIICYDRWSPTPGLRPVIPLEPYYHGRCP